MPKNVVGGEKMKIKVDWINRDLMAFLKINGEILQPCEYYRLVIKKVQNERNVKWEKVEIPTGTIIVETKSGQNFIKRGENFLKFPYILINPKKNGRKSSHDRQR